MLDIATRRLALSRRRSPTFAIEILRSPCVGVLGIAALSPTYESTPSLTTQPWLALNRRVKPTAIDAYADFVVWFNFLAGFAYVLAGVALGLRQRWAAALAWLIALATLLVFAVFGLHVASSAAYEMRTVAAMSLRSAVWLAISWMAWRWRLP